MRINPIFQISKLLSTLSVFKKKKTYIYIYFQYRNKMEKRESGKKTKESGYSLFIPSGNRMKLIQSDRNYAQLYPRLSFPSRNQTEIMRERSICWWDDSLEVELDVGPFPPSPSGINTSQEQTAIR